MMKVLHDRVLVLKRAEESPGLIQLGPTATHVQRGEVVAVGTGYESEDGTPIPLELKPGDSVVFGKYVGNDVKIDGADYIIMQESDVFGVLCPP